MPTLPITERELRDHVRAELSLQAAASGGRLYEELSIEQGAARVDLAVVSDLLEAYELKSDLDDFGRLHNQIHAYNRVFDRITLITGPIFARAALELMPPWWGVSVVRRSGNGSLETQVIRVPLVNTGQDPYSVAMFLWREEAIETLETETGLAVPKYATRSQLHERLATTLSFSSLRSRVTRRLLTRGIAIKQMPSIPDGGLSRPDANCSGFHCLI